MRLRSSVPRSPNSVFRPLLALSLGSALALGGVFSGLSSGAGIPAEAATATAAPEPALITHIPTLTVPGDSASGEDPTGGTWDIGVTSNGTYAYATSAADSRLFVFDLEQRLHIATLTLGDAGSASAKAPVFLAQTGNVGAVLGGDRKNPRVYIVDTAQHSLAHTFNQLTEFGYVGAIAPNGDHFYYASPTWGEVKKLNTATGAIEQQTSYLEALGVKSLSVSSDGQELNLSRKTSGGSTLKTLRTADLSDLTVVPLTTEAYTQLEQSRVNAHLYGTTTSGSIAKLDRASGVVLSTLPGTTLNNLVADPTRDVAWATSGSSHQVVAADFGTGSFLGAGREVPGTPSAVALRPSTNDAIPGELVATTGDPSISGITVLRTPSIAAHPVNVNVTRTGEEAHFSATIDGVTPGHISWQESDTGSAWSDIPRSAGTQLTVTAGRDTVTKQYRAVYADPFWGVNGATTPARLVAPAPTIVPPVAAVTGTVGTPITPITFNAHAQLGHTWSAASLPAGLLFDSQSGTLSGTPAAASEEPLQVTVSDDFGTATAEISVRIAAAPMPMPTPTPAPGTDADRQPGSGQNPPATTPDPLAQSGVTGFLVAAFSAVLVLVGGGALLLRRRGADRA